MSRRQTMFTENFQSQMELLDLHKQLNDELEKFTLCLNNAKQQSISETLHTTPNYYHITEKIRDLNTRIQSLAATAMKHILQTPSNQSYLN